MIFKKIKLGHLEYYAMRLWILFKPLFELLVIPTLVGEEGALPYYYQMEVDIQVLLLACPDTQNGGVPL